MVLSALHVGMYDTAYIAGSIASLPEHSQKHGVHSYCVVPAVYTSSYITRKPFGGRLHSIRSHFSRTSEVLRIVWSCQLRVHDVHEFWLQRCAADQEAVNVQLVACMAIQLLEEYMSLKVDALSSLQLAAVTLPP
jgi:hypothetical protein